VNIVNNPHGILVFGASGSGTTTLGRELARLLNFEHHDIDDYFWEKTDPPFTQERPHDGRIVLLKSSLKNNFILSGCIREWGGVVDPMLSMAVFLKTPTDLRMERLEKREFNRYGERIQPGGDLFDRHREFIEYGATYDIGGMETRSLASQCAWAKTLTCPVIDASGADDFRKTAVVVVEFFRECIELGQMEELK